MRAVVLTEYGGPEVLRVADVADPVPGPDEILVNVEHTAINRADVLQRRGRYADPRQPLVEIPGLEYAGTVAVCGSRVSEWHVGDAVMGIESGGCYAELLVTHSRQAMAVPRGLDRREAAAVPEVFLTAWDAVVVQGGLTSGRWALVHAGASGVGTAAIQIAKAIGAHIAVTCSAGKMHRCLELGADIVVERSPSDWLGALRESLVGHGVDGVDVVLDVVGGEEVARNLSAVRQRGTIVQVGLLGGGAAEVDVGALLAKRVHWVGTVLRSRPLEEKISVSRRFATEVLPLFTAGRLRPVIDRRFALADVAEAHRVMEADANVGKLLIDI
ncbi:MAG TPA: NAD(P)H-quinone oxidoreductase [Desertimonas sp.]|nr:NAD(P)H-quinone oxidoreductase [Desertimonas sp.]